MQDPGEVLREGWEGGGEGSEGQEEGKDGSGPEAVMLFLQRRCWPGVRCLPGQIASPSTAL